MRLLLALAIVLMGTISAIPEPEYPALLTDRFATDDFGTTSVLIESSTVRGDRLPVTLSVDDGPHKEAVETATAHRDQQNAVVDTQRPLVVEDLHPDLMNGQLAVFASADPSVDAAIMAHADGAAARPNDVSMDDLCDALYASAQNNDLPIPFFANLIWQESRMKVDDVSKKGAQGIAQFMPKVAVEKGLADPFDPLQALPASAKLLNELRLQFGNLGFVAAAYNAGPNRVIAWLERRGDLPRETRNYVVKVTGLSIDAWRHMPVDGNALTFVGRLPCRNLPAYANVEQLQSEQAQLVQAKLDQIEVDDPMAGDNPVDDTPVGSIARKSDRTAEHHAHRKGEARKESRETHRGHEHRAIKQEAAHKPRGIRDKKAA